VYVWLPDHPETLCRCVCLGRVKALTLYVRPSNSSRPCAGSQGASEMVRSLLHGGHSLRFWCTNAARRYRGACHSWRCDGPCCPAGHAMPSVPPIKAPRRDTLCHELPQGCLHASHSVRLWPQVSLTCAEGMSMYLAIERQSIMNEASFQSYSDRDAAVLASCTGECTQLLLSLPLTSLLLLCLECAHLSCALSCLKHNFTKEHRV